MTAKRKPLVMAMSKEELVCKNRYGSLTVATAEINSDPLSQELLRRLAEGERLRKGIGKILATRRAGMMAPEIILLETHNDLYALLCTPKPEGSAALEEKEKKG